MVNLESQYPGKIDPSSSNYPYGEPRNITVPGDGTGTPFEAAWIKDLAGLQQATVAQAGIVPSGNPDTAVLSQFLEGIKKLTLDYEDTVATLRARTDDPSANPSNAVFLRGHTTVDDGAFGSLYFKWDATSTTADNGGTIIKLTSIATGRYLLQYSGAVNVEWFGAVGDGVRVANQVEIQKALDSGASQVYAPYSVYLMASRVTVPVGVTLRGDGIGKTTLKMTASERVVVLSDDSSIHGMTLDANNLHGVSELTALSIASNCNVTNIEAMGAYSGVSLGDATSQSKSFVTNLITHDNTSRGILIDPFGSYNILKNIHSYSNGNAGILIGHGSHDNIVDGFTLSDINNASLWLHQGAYNNIITNGIITDPALASSVGINIGASSYGNRVSNMKVYGYIRGGQIVGDDIDGVYPAIPDHESNFNIISDIDFYGSDNTDTDSYGFTFQQQGPATPTANNNVVKNCSFDGYYGVFRNVSDAANNCNIHNIATTNVGAGEVMKAMFSSSNVIKADSIEGFKIKEKYVTDTFAIDSTGQKTVPFAHGLDYTPDFDAVSAMLYRETAVDDFVIDFV